MNKFLKSSLCLTFAFLLLTQPCFAFVGELIPMTLPQKMNTSTLMGPAEACFSPQRLSRPSASGLHSKQILALRHWSNGGTLPASNFLRAAQNQSSSPAKTQLLLKSDVERDISGSVLKLDLINGSLRTSPIYIGFNPLRVFEPGYYGNRLTMAAPNGLHNYGYDNIYQLLNVSGAQTHSFAYDNVGNRTNADGTIYTPNNLNQYAQVGATAYQYDQNGNLTNDGVYTYAYDYENRLISTSGNGHNATYVYDPFGRRISKTVDGITTKFIYDADRIIEERDGSNQLIASYIYGEGIDEILRMDRAGSSYYYFYDGLGSVTDITNNNGEVIESYAYDVYGLPNHASTIGNRYLFTGREYDGETGLYYYRARYYSPIIGRFLQKDPITWTPSDERVSYKEDMISETTKNLIQARGIFDTKLLHNYNYVHNNPVSFIDPSGTFPQILLVGLAAGLGGGVANSIFALASGQRKPTQLFKAFATGFATGFIGGVLAFSMTPKLGLVAARTVSGVITGSVFSDPLTGGIGGFAAGLSGLPPFFASSVGRTVANIIAPTEAGGNQGRCNR